MRAKPWCESPHSMKRSKREQYTTRGARPRPGAVPWSGASRTATAGSRADCAGGRHRRPAVPVRDWRSSPRPCKRQRMPHTAGSTTGAPSAVPDCPANGRPRRERLERYRRAKDDDRQTKKPGLFRGRASERSGRARSIWRAASLGANLAAPAWRVGPPASRPPPKRCQKFAPPPRPPTPGHCAESSPNALSSRYWD